MEQEVSFADINELTEKFAQNSTKFQLNLEETQEQSLETILRHQLFTIKYNMKLRNLIVSKLVPLLTNKNKVNPQNKDIVALQNLFEVARKNNQETNNTQKVINSILVINANGIGEGE